MKELKSKKTGKIQTITDQEYNDMVTKGVIDMKKFIVTDLKVRELIPSLKTPPLTKKKKNEG